MGEAPALSFLLGLRQAGRAAGRRGDIAGPREPERLARTHRSSNQPCAGLPPRKRGPPNVWQPCTPRKACRCQPNTLAELQRDMARLGFVVSQIREIEDARQKRLEQQPETGPHAMVRRLARIVGVGVETADMLVHEVLSRPMRDRRAVARGACPRAGQWPDPGAGLTGSPDESGAKRREQGLARLAPGENRGLATPGSAAAWSNSPGAFCRFRRRARSPCGIAPAPLIAVVARARQ